MAWKNPDMCDVCANPLLDEADDYCPWCGAKIKKIEVPDGKKEDGGSSSFLGLLGLLAFIFLLIVLMAK